jgi:hypothetical protein
MTKNKKFNSWYISELTDGDGSFGLASALEVQVYVEP